MYKNFYVQVKEILNAEEHKEENSNHEISPPVTATHNRLAYNLPVFFLCI